MRHLQAVQNLDSILKLVWELVLPLKDSFPNDLNNRLLNVNLPISGNPRIRISTYPPRGNSFVKTADGLAHLKIERDTLHITGFFSEEKKATGSRYRYMAIEHKTGKDVFISHSPWVITVLINNLSELPSITGTLNPYMSSIAADYISLTGYNPKKNFTYRVNLVYEPLSTYTGKDKYIVYNPVTNKYNFQVVVQAGVQNVQSGFAASAGLGLGVSSISFSRPGKSFFLVWEPFFFFDKNGSGKTVIQRNDFITFQFKNRFARLDKSSDINLSNNFSLGYLFHREGDYFNKNTFKFGLPGMEFRNLLLQPQFIFNDFFKQFYPGIKLLVQLD
jgi:hypothetical protein